jgi:hypothetical protein
MTCHADILTLITEYPGKKAQAPFIYISLSPHDDSLWLPEEPSLHSVAPISFTQSLNEKLPNC